MSDALPPELISLRIQHKLRAAFITVFRGTGDSGALVLATIGKKCGVENIEADTIDPSLTAFWNWLMTMVGVRTASPNENITMDEHYQEYIQEMKVLQSIMNMNDVTKELSQIGGEEDGKDGA